MSILKEKIYEMLPGWLKDQLVTLYDVQQYKIRHGGNYSGWKNYHQQFGAQKIDLVAGEQIKRLKEFLHYTYSNSSFYKELYDEAEVNLATINAVEDLRSLPIIKKEDLRSNIAGIRTIPAQDAVKSNTGGTTGKSLEVYYTKDNMRERFATLDVFRGQWGYELGKKTIWFSGKNLLSSTDLKRNIYWRTDWYYNIRYFSTYHINSNTVKSYIESIEEYKPEYIVGFPSSIYEIARLAIELKISLNHKVKAVFPTAESIVDHEKDVIQSFFGGGVYNQYASSEGAPFITECTSRKLHANLLSGIFEVVDDDFKPAEKGQILVTSFTTRGTPLIRYAIGDAIEWATDEKCECGSAYPLVKSIDGRINDYILSQETGKMNLGNLSNCVKYVKGVVKFQVIQKIPEAIEVCIVKDGQYTEKDEQMFLLELRRRLGESIRITFEYLEEIPREPSGKYRLIKNLIQ